MTKAATPEPMPKCEGVEVTPHLLTWIESQAISPDKKQEIVRDILARHEYGLRKYGQPLMSEDGRDHINDARQEALDFLQYSQAAKLQGVSLAPLLPLMRLIVRMIEGDCP